MITIFKNRGRGLEAGLRKLFTSELKCKTQSQWMVSKKLCNLQNSTQIQLYIISICQNLIF